MDKDEAQGLITKELQRWRARSYDDLVTFIKSSSVTAEVLGDSGVCYQLEMQFFWDDKKRGHIRVCAAIDDGGMLAFMPLTDCFIMASDGSFVDE